MSTGPTIQSELLDSGLTGIRRTGGLNRRRWGRRSRVESVPREVRGSRSSFRSELVGAALSEAPSWVGGHRVVDLFQPFMRAWSGPPVASRSPSIAVSGTRGTAGPVNGVCLGCSPELSFRWDST